MNVQRILRLQTATTDATEPVLRARAYDPRYDAAEQGEWVCDEAITRDIRSPLTVLALGWCLLAPPVWLGGPSSSTNGASYEWWFTKEVGAL